MFCFVFDFDFVLSIWGDMGRAIWMQQTAGERSELVNVRTTASVS